MTSFISSSERAVPLVMGGRRWLRTDGRCVGVFVGTFVVLLVAGAAYQALWDKGRRTPIVARAEPPQSDGWYLSYSRGATDGHVIYHDLYGAAAAMRKADVLFLGNSQVMFTFRQEVLAPFFAELGLRYYVLGFPYGEANFFPERIISKYNLRPKWVIVNCDPFFLNRMSPYAKKVVADSWWDAWKHQFEMDRAFDVRSRLHRVVPYFDSMRPKKGDWVLFRSYEDGTSHVAVTEGRSREATPRREQPYTGMEEQWLRNAAAFKARMERRGIQVVLTTLPPRPADMAMDTAAVLGVPAVVPHVKRLRTCDGYHLDTPSATRYAKAFLEELRGVLQGEAKDVSLRAEGQGPGADRPVPALAGAGGELAK